MKEDEEIENQENPTEEKEFKRPIKKILKLSRCYRFFLYLILLSMECTMNIDSGLLSSASKNIKKTLKMTDMEFGIFGPANSSGRVLGSFLFILLNQKFSLKWISAVFLAIQSASLICFKVTTEKKVLIVIRFCIGFSHMPATIYCPVWINQFGVRNYKNIMMAAVQLFQPAGKCLAFLIHILVGESNWQMGFVIEGVYLIFCTLCIMISSEDFFSVKLSSKPVDDDCYPDKERISCTIFEEDFEAQIGKEKKKEEKSSFIGDLIILSKNSVFVLGLLCRCLLYGLNTCLHFWISDFMRTVVNVQSSYVIFTSYTVICIAGPLGGLITNTVFKPCIGGYDSRKSSWPLVGFQIGCSIFAIGLSFMRTTIKFIAFTVCYFVFNSSALPILQGILISCVDKRIAATGFSLANIFTQLLTAGTTPVIYGYINDHYKKYYPSLAMLCMMSMQAIAVPILALMAILRNRNFDKIEEEKRLQKQKLLEEQGQELEDK